MHIDKSRVHDFKNANIEGAISLFNKIYWSQTSSHMDIHETWDLFKLKRSIKAHIFLERKEKERKQSGWALELLEL